MNVHPNGMVSFWLYPLGSRKEGRTRELAQVQNFALFLKWPVMQFHNTELCPNSFPSVNQVFS